MEQQGICPHCKLPLYPIYVVWKGRICYFCGKVVPEKQEEKVQPNVRTAS